MSPVTPFLISAGIIAAVSIPLIVQAVPPNRFYGFRTPRTLSNERIWYAANRFAGWALLFAAITSAAVLATTAPEASPGYAAVALVAPILVALVASFIFLRGIGEQ